MEVQIEITSSEIVKPSSPTPPHLSHLTLSLAEQLAPWVYSPLVFFYPAKTDSDLLASSRIVSTLKDSFSRTLTLFYPIAGRISADESAIECNDEGVPFVVARANLTLSDLLARPDKPELVKHFLPISDNISLGRDPRESANIPRDKIIEQLVSFAVKVTVFECGGVAIGTFGLHKIFDGCTAGGIFRTWAAMAAGRDVEVREPDFNTIGTIFPGISSEQVPKSTMPLTMWPVEGGECVVKPFVFTPEKIAELRVESKSDTVPNPTRIEAVTAFIWKHALAAADANARRKNGGLKGPSVLIHSVNIRAHMSPPIPLTVVGNLVMHGYTYVEDKDPKISELVPEIRKAITEARDPELLKELQGERANELLLLSRKHIGGLISNPNLNRYRFTSWGRFDMDFGFGKPVWTGIIGGRLSSVFRNVVPLLDRMDYGLEAWMVLLEEEMSILENNVEFLKFACPNGGSIDKPIQ